MALFCDVFYSVEFYVTLHLCYIKIFNIVILNWIKPMSCDIKALRYSDMNATSLFIRDVYIDIEQNNETEPVGMMLVLDTLLFVIYQL